MSRQIMDLLKVAKAQIDDGKFAEATEALESGLEYSPSAEIEAEIHFQAGFCRLKLEEYAEAAKSFNAALSTAEDWDYVDKKHIFELLRIAYKDQPDYYKLAALCRELLSHEDNEKDKGTLVSSLLYACIKTDNWDEMAQAIDEFPDIDLGAKASLYKVICFTKMARIKEAYQASREYIEKFGEDHEICANLLLLSYVTRNGPAGVEYYKKAVKMIDDPGWLFMAGSKLLGQDLYQGAISDEEFPGIIEGIRQATEKLETNKVFHGTRKPFRKIRLGYLSADLGNHPVGYFLLSVMMATVTTHSFIKCYCLNIPSEEDSEVTKKFMTLANAWEEVYDKPDSYIEQSFLNDEIDIAFDMMCHSNNNRLQVYAKRVAPIQISWIGFPVTTGVAAMDYVIADKLVDPPGSEKYYTEKLLYMPDNFLCHILSGNPGVEPPAFVRNGYITFACFHNLVKVTDTTLRMWGRIMEKNETARLKIMGLLPKSEELREMLDERFKKYGLPMERVSISPMCGMEKYFEAYNDADIMLDTYPFSGATTTFDALSMGRPIITLAGERHVSRVSYSLLVQVGLEDLAAFSEDEYVEKVLALANDRERLLEINKMLPERVKNSPLTDQEAFRKNYEKIIRDVWVSYCFENRLEEYNYSADNPPELLEQVVNATVYLERKIGLGEEISGQLADEYHKAQKAFYEKLPLVTKDENFINEYGKLVGLIERRLDGKNFKLPVLMAKRHLAVFCEGEL